MKKGWLVNDTLTCIPGTKTFWHNLLDWVPNLEDKCGGYTPFGHLPVKIENEYSLGNKPDYIIRNATYFRPLNIPIKTISLLQDLSPDNQQQIDVCNKSDIVVFNSPYTQSFYVNKITSKTVMIPLGVDFNKFKPLDTDFTSELGLLPDSILFIGANNNHPKGFDIMLDIINNTSYNFCLVMKDGYSLNHPRVRVFNKVDHDTLIKIMNSCKLLVCTSRTETQHLAGIEAAACGLPLVTSNVGIYYGKQSGDWGINVNSFNSKDFILAIETIMNHQNEMNPRLEFIKCGLTLEDCRDKWINLIDNL